MYFDNIEAIAHNLSTLTLSDLKQSVFINKYSGEIVLYHLTKFDIKTNMFYTLWLNFEIDNNYKYCIITREMISNITYTLYNKLENLRSSNMLIDYFLDFYFETNE